MDVLKSWCKRLVAFRIHNVDELKSWYKRLVAFRIHNVDVLKSWCKRLVAFVCKAVMSKIKGFNYVGFEFSVVNKIILQFCMDIVEKLELYQ